MNKARAEYREIKIERFRDNPYIEALPPMLSEKEIMNLFFFRPKVTNAMREGTADERIQELGVLEDFLTPIEIHQKIYRNIYTMIVNGYVHRNPYRREDLKLINEGNIDLEGLVSSQDFASQQIGPPQSFYPTRLLLGVSGIGKTTTIERLMQTIPQVIYHTSYKGKPLTRTQITYLKIDCPPNALVTSFCRQFLRAFDDILDTNIYEKAAIEENHSYNTMISTIRGLIQLYGVGVVFIDEVQNLIQDDKNAQKLGDLFVSLINYLKVPIYFIGTPKFLKLLDTNVRSKRRFGSEGLILWDRVQEESEDWDTFIQNLWSIQLTKNVTPLTAELSHTIYEQTQGILAFVVALFKAVQQNLIMDSSKEEERITSEFILKIAEEEFCINQPLIQAIKENNLPKMMAYEDLVFDVLDHPIISAKKVQDHTNNKLVALQLKQREEEERTILEGLYQSLVSFDCFEYLKEEDLREICEEVLEEYGSEKGLAFLKRRSFQEASSKEEALGRIREINKKTKEKDNLDPVISSYQEAQRDNRRVADVLEDKGLRGIPYD